MFAFLPNPTFKGELEICADQCGSHESRAATEHVRSS